jgi:Domain of unknown function (DUF4129)
LIGAAAVMFSLIAEGSAAYAVTKLLTGPFADGERQAANIGIFVVVAVAGFAVPRLLDALGFAMGRTTAIAIVATFVFVYGGLRIEFAGDVALWDLTWAGDFMRDASDVSRNGTAEMLSGVSLFAMWSRSWWRSRREVETDLLPRDSALPFGVVTVALVLAAPGDNAGAVAAGVLAFYAAALLSLACSQLARSGKTIGTIRSGDVVVVLLVSTIVATLLGVLVFGLLFGLTVDLLEPVVTGPVASGFEFLLVALFTPIAWLMQLLVDLVQSLLGNPEPAEIEQGAPFAQTDQVAELPENGDSDFGRVFGIFARISLVAFALSVLAFVVFLLVRLRRSHSRDRDDRSESSSAGGLGGDLRNAWNALFSRRSRPRRHETGAVRLYLDVLDSAEESGVQRPVSATAAEFQGALHERFHTDATDEITALFQQARYASREPDAEAIDSLRRRWMQSDDS